MRRLLQALANYADISRDISTLENQARPDQLKKPAR
jgi:hypothetical protein